MNDFNNRLVNTKMPSATIPELNNNSEHVLDGIYRPRSESRASTISSASSSNETSDEIELPEVLEEQNKDNTDEAPDKRRFRSMSDGSPAITGSDETFEVFPSLPDSVLEKMGLLGDNPKERLNEEESEQKFIALALAFSIDATTIKDRCQRQKRYRDQTEKNLSVEIDRLVDKVYRMQPLCVDAETTEMLTDLLTQVDTVTRASVYAAISAERFGAVQHEERLTQAVELMIKHVALLKQQRDSARKHLQYTKRMLQNTNNLNETQTLPKAKTMHSRRASIAIINQQSSSLKVNIDSKRITRRTSEMSIRASALPRNTRPPRLELGVDLVKIREGTTEETTPTPLEDIALNEQGLEIQANDLFDLQNETEDTNIDTSILSFRQRMLYRMSHHNDKITKLYKNWCDTGTINEIFVVAALICFSFSIIILGNILIELEYAKYNCTSNYSWDFENSWMNLIPFLANNYEEKEMTT